MLRAVSLFSGAGGFCEGVRLAGFSIRCAVEHDPDACRTHAANFSGIPLFAGDIADFLVTDVPGVPSRRELRSDSIDLVFGGPPCQGFSQIGPRDPADPRNLLYKEFVRVVRELKPRVFVMENVPNMLAMKSGFFRRRLLKAFADAGYRRVSIHSLIASDFGVPQERKRVFIIGLHNSVPLAADLNVTFERLISAQRSKSKVSVWDAISDLPRRVADNDQPLPYPKKTRGKFTAYQKLMRLDSRAASYHSGKKSPRRGALLLHNHHTKGMKARRRKIVALIKPGMTGDSLPARLWSGVRGHKWRRLDPDRPSYTILAQMSRDLSEWIHPVEDRWITVREAARLQAFQDKFIFQGSEYQQLKQVGNAVPPILGFAVAAAAKNLLKLSRKHGRGGPSS